ncbi:MAG TPA: nucleoside monophosphate kinase [Candidatus Dormibacteraeota bacterium]|nr:nucleoside monophosphate kinase [Candidatus Dormibacteraeota bacterium]
MTDTDPGPSAPDPRRILLLVGAAGAGKGTQAETLSRELGLAHLASGNLFREAQRDGTPLGETAQQYMERGDLVPDEITTRMFMEQLSKPSATRGAILDGFPRTVAQASALDATLAAQGEGISRVFFVDVPTEELIERLAGRFVCPACGTPYHLSSDPPRVAGICDKDDTPLEQRDDDRPEVVRARLAKQVPPMLEVVDHYDRAGIVTRVDGRQQIDAVTRAILDELGER